MENIEPKGEILTIVGRKAAKNYVGDKLIKGHYLV